MWARPAGSPSMRGQPHRAGACGPGMPNRSPRSSWRGIGGSSGSSTSSTARHTASRPSISGPSPLRTSTTSITRRWSPHGLRYRPPRRTRPANIPRPGRRRQTAGVSSDHAAHTALAADLAAALAPDRVRTGGVELGLYGRDASVLAGEAAVACFPSSTAEVAAAVRIARQHGRPFVARGSGTGLAGGAVPVGDPGGDRDHEDGPHPVGRPRRPRRLGRARRRQPRPHPGARPARPALRPRPVEPAGLHDRRQRGQQLGRARTAWPTG